MNTPAFALVNVTAYPSTQVAFFNEFVGTHATALESPEKQCSFGRLGGPFGHFQYQCLTAFRQPLFFAHLIQKALVMKNVFLVSYDVCEAKRLRQTYKKLCGFGVALQYSVFRCELSPIQLQTLKEQLWSILNLSEDRVMVVDLGPAGARGDECVEFWGTSRMLIPSRTAVIV